MRFQFIASEIGIGLRRNLTMTISVVLVTTVSLLLFGFGILAQTQVTLIKNYWLGQVEVSVFFCSKTSVSATCTGPATPAQQQAIEAGLKSPQLAPFVESYRFETKDEAFGKFKKMFAKDKILLETSVADDMPESYQIKLKNPKDFPVISQAFQNRPGVDQVKDQSVILQRLFALIGGLKWGAWALAMMTLGSTVLLVATTIRLTAFTRRRETAIMRLVGASNLVIQLPFILEGMVASLVGGILASILLVVVDQFAINGWLAGLLPFIPTWVSMGDTLLVVPVILLVGLGISGVSSFLSLLRYLKV
jgi:cell division transport system permease protein